MNFNTLIALVILTASRALVAWCPVLGCSLSMTAAGSSFAAAEAQIAAPVLGRFVRIEHRGTRPSSIEIAEVEVYSDRVNIASLGEASEGPGTWSPAELAIDGVEKGDLYFKRSTAITPQAVGAFWELAFPKPAKYVLTTVITLAFVTPLFAAETQATGNPAATPGLGGLPDLQDREAARLHSER